MMPRCQRHGRKTTGKGSKNLGPSGKLDAPVEETLLIRQRLRDLCELAIAIGQRKGLLANYRRIHKMQKLTKIPESKILLLHDEYVHSDQDDYKACQNEIQALTSFHTVFVIKDQTYSFLLASKDGTWATKRFPIMPAIPDS